jgi:UDP-glucose 4-epimerase
VTTHAWVIGARGLLGSAVVRAVEHRPGWALAPSAPLPWGDSGELALAAEDAASALVDGVADGDDWTVVWCAGRAVTSSSAGELEAELDQLASVLAGVQLALDDRPERRPGSLFYASSAGGVYAGADDPPFDERTPPRPLSGYGSFKLDAERIATAFAQTLGLSAVNGRIANLYGPGQSLDKMQGLISHLAKAQLSPAPASVYVSLDTLRDYIYADDCAALVLDCLDRSLLAARSGVPVSVTKNLISGQGVTIAALISQLKTITKRNANVMLGSSASAALQAHDLRLNSVVWSDLDARELTPLGVGIHNTVDEMRSLMQRGAPPS